MEKCLLNRKGPYDKYCYKCEQVLTSLCFRILTYYEYAHIASVPLFLGKHALLSSRSRLHYTSGCWQ